MATPLNKSSTYIQSLTDFILDTKPYHAKLTEVVEEYQFSDTLNVKITEATFVRDLDKAAWPYSFFSGGNPTNRTMQVQRLVVPDFLQVDKNDDPLNSAGRFKAQRDENVDMLGVPLVFSKKQFDGVGIAEAWLEVGGTNVQPYVEGVDYLQSHGSLQVQLRQIYDFQSNLKPLWSETRTDGVVATAAAETLALANDIGNPLSANRQLRAFVVMLATHLIGNPVASPPAAAASHASALAACADLILELDIPNIPQPYTVSGGGLVITGYYDAIVTGATDAGVPPPAGFTGWIGEDGTPSGATYVDERFGQLLPPLILNFFSDMDLYQSGSLEYDDVTSPNLTITNIVASTSAPNYEEWELKCIDTSPVIWQVAGTSSGVIGTFTPGGTFSVGPISFTHAGSGTPVLNSVVLLTPRNQITIHSTAQTEAWNIIKVNPLAYDRPVFESAAYGHIEDLTAQVGRVSLLDPSLPAGTLVLTATSATSFTLTHTADPLYTATVPVNTVFNDGRVGFTIIAGTTFAFQPGDRFYIQIANGPAQALNLDLYYGYDLDSYDNWDSPGGSVVYDGQNGSTAGDPIRFAYDSRFSDYDPSTMNLVVTQAAVDGRQFRLVAIPDGPAIATLKKDGSGPVEYVDLEDALGGATPPVYSMPGDANPAVDLALFYANTFRLEYSDDGFNTVTVVGNVPAGGSFSDTALGISFTIAPASKPFIAADSDDGLAQPRVQGGDMFQWTIANPPPVQTVVPAGLSGALVPHLVMQGDGFYWAPPAAWTVTFTSPTAYTVSATYTAGPSAGGPVPGYPVSGTLSLPGTGIVEGTTFRTDEVHFTIKAGQGLGAGDKFTFNTFERKPCFGVYGTVSGWQPPAEYDRWYWNGSIGFKVRSPKHEVFLTAPVDPVPFISGYYAIGPGYVQPVRLRADCPSLNYRFSVTPGGYVVTRSDRAVVGWAPLNGTYTDEFLKVNISNVGVDFILKVQAEQLDFWQAQDTLVVKSNIDALMPTSSDFVAVRKTEEGSIGISLDYTSLLVPPSLTPLAPVAQDPAYIDTYTNGVPLEVTSPETAWLNNWLPMYVEKYDSATSPAEFPDQADRFTLRSAATGNVIATVYPSGTSLQEPTLLQWDSSFFSTYLPLNAQANVVTYGTGMDENVRVLMSEKVNFLFSGDALLVNALFQDTASVVVTEETEWAISMAQNEVIAAVVSDGPFGGFLAGYDNLPYDAEDALGLDIPSLTAAQGAYDTGTPLVDHYLRAEYLALQGSLTVAEQEELDMLLLLIQAYLNGSNLTWTPLQRLQNTTLQDFITALNADAYAGGGTGPTMGIPTVGAAMDVLRGNGYDTSNPSDETGAAAISEAMFIYIAEDDDLYDENPYDTLPMDAYGDDTAYLLSNGAIHSAGSFVVGGFYSIRSVGTTDFTLIGAPSNAVGVSFTATGVGSGTGMANFMYPVPNPTPVFTTYAALETPLAVEGLQARIFDISFANPPPSMPVPNIQVWLPTEAAPQPAGVVQIVSNGLFRFTIPEASEAKIVVT